MASIVPQLPPAGAEAAFRLMNLIIGIVVVFGCVLGGIAVHGGRLGALWQPSEPLIIGGAACGALIIANPFRITSAWPPASSSC
jgi:flagellar motor component MotA